MELRQCFLIPSTSVTKVKATRFDFLLPHDERAASAINFQSHEGTQDYRSHCICDLSAQCTCYHRLPCQISPTMNRCTSSQKKSEHINRWTSMIHRSPLSSKSQPKIACHERRIKSKTNPGHFMIQANALPSYYRNPGRQACRQKSRIGGAPWNDSGDGEERNGATVRRSAHSFKFASSEIRGEIGAIRQNLNVDS